jgi:hypothetical protein
MAYAIAIVAAITGLLAAPALAAEDVYVWRDASGVVRFSTVSDPRDDRPAADTTVSADRDAAAQIAANGAKN